MFIRSKSKLVKNLRYSYLSRTRDGFDSVSAECLRQLRVTLLGEDPSRSVAQSSIVPTTVSGEYILDGACVSVGGDRPVRIVRVNDDDWHLRALAKEGESVSEVLAKELGDEIVKWKLDRGVFKVAVRRHFFRVVVHLPTRPLLPTRPPPLEVDSSHSIKYVASSWIAASLSSSVVNTCSCAAPRGRVTYRA